MYRITKNAKYKNNKKYKNTKNTQVPAISTKKQNIKEQKTQKTQKVTCATYFPQNFQMMYRDSTKNQIKNRGVCYFAL